MILAADLTKWSETLAYETGQKKRHSECSKSGKNVGDTGEIVKKFK